MFLVACLTIASLADTLQLQQCYKGDAVGRKLEVESIGCQVLTVGGVQFNLTFTQLQGNSDKQTLTAIGNSFTEGECMSDTTDATEIACSCDSGSEFTFVCDGASFAFPSLLVLVASVMVYMM
eukprot:TRINITY_DN4244_c0_g1_i1.p1 TRINITY_DN4244_c0_g1~~TRINITY_DN4244_c0_g1_i1.p1  ORF type:complete len:123 (+),score=18.36 TRINITY_DN4244_c0_g1_i1:155-523(+)